jgi:hypothetical protein
MSTGAVVYAISWVDGSFSWSTMSSTSCSRSWNLPILCSSSLRWLVVWAAVNVGFVLFTLLLLFSYVFALSSIFAILSIRSSTTFSRWSMRFCYVWLISFWSTISFCSLVMSSFIWLHTSLTATFFASYSCLSRTVASPIYRTLSSSAFPAVWTVLICSSAWSFHVVFALDFTTRSAICVAWFLRLPTTWD